MLGSQLQWAIGNRWHDGFTVTDTGSDTHLRRGRHQRGREQRRFRTGQSCLRLDDRRFGEVLGRQRRGTNWRRNHVATTRSHGRGRVARTSRRHQCGVGAYLRGSRHRCPVLLGLEHHSAIGRRHGHTSSPADSGVRIVLGHSGRRGGVVAYLCDDDDERREVLG